MLRGLVKDLYNVHPSFLNKSDPSTDDGERRLLANVIYEFGSIISKARAHDDYSAVQFGAFDPIQRDDNVPGAPRHEALSMDYKVSSKFESHGYKVDAEAGYFLPYFRVKVTLHKDDKTMETEYFCPYSELSEDEHGDHGIRNEDYFRFQTRYVDLVTGHPDYSRLVDYVKSSGMLKEPIEEGFKSINFYPVELKEDGAIGVRVHGIFTDQDTYLFAVIDPSGRLIAYHNHH